jgi:outer membrane receptor protein involved in Fe transport
LKLIETVATGELFDLPAGPLAMAVGAQARNLIRTERAAAAALARDDYNSDIFLQPEARVVTENEVHAVFAELNVPIVKGLEMQLAGRHEEFKDLDLKATSPKVAVRYQPFRNIAFRASYGEGFLAPTPNQVLVEDAPDCSEVFTGVDPFYPGVAAANLNGSTSCRNGNPDLTPEESTVFNVGFTWQIIDDLEFSLDYQTIDYTDRIIEMASTDIVNRDFASFLAASGIASSAYTASTYNSAANTAARDAWFASGDRDTAIERGGNVGGVAKVATVTRSYENLSSNKVNVFDGKLSYSIDLDEFGYITSQYAGTYFAKYEYTGLDKVTRDAVGLQNGNTNLAPPLPQWKHQLRTAWQLGSHDAAITAKHQDGVRFDTLSIGGPWANHRPEFISSYTTFDVRYGYHYDTWDVAKLSFAIGSTNVTNTKPDRLPILNGFESRLGDPFGRMYYAEVTASFE